MVCTHPCQPSLTIGGQPMLPRTVRNAMPRRAARKTPALSSSAESARNAAGEGEPPTRFRHQERGEQIKFAQSLGKPRVASCIDV